MYVKQQKMATAMALPQGLVNKHSLTVNTRQATNPRPLTLVESDTFTDTPAHHTILRLYLHYSYD